MMRSLAERLKAPWDFMRLLRLGLGVTLLVQVAVKMDYLALGLGIFLIGQAVLNTGCCGVSGCETRAGRSAASHDGKEPTSYEEIK